MPNKNNLTSIKLKTNKMLEVPHMSYKKTWRRAKPLSEKCSEPVMLKFTPSEMKNLKEVAGLIPLATFIKHTLNKNTD